MWTHNYKCTTTSSIITLPHSWRIYRTSGAWFFCLTFSALPSSHTHNQTCPVPLLLPTHKAILLAVICLKQPPSSVIFLVVTPILPHHCHWGPLNAINIWLKMDVRNLLGLCPSSNSYLISSQKQMKHDQLMKLTLPSHLLHKMRTNLWATLL